MSQWLVSLTEDLIIVKVGASLWHIVYLILPTLKYVHHQGAKKMGIKICISGADLD